MNENFLIPPSCSLFNIKTIYNEFINRIGFDGFQNLVINSSFDDIIVSSGVQTQSGFSSNFDLTQTPLSMNTGEFFSQDLKLLSSNEVYTFVFDFKSDQDINFKFVNTPSSVIVDDNGVEIDISILAETDDFGNPIRQQQAITFYTGLYSEASPASMLFTALTPTLLEIYNISIVRGTFAVNLQKTECCFSDYVRYADDGINGYYELSSDGGFTYNRIYTSSTQDIAQLVLDLSPSFYTAAECDTMFLRKDIQDSASRIITFLDGLRTENNIELDTNSAIIMGGGEIVVNSSQTSGMPALNFNITVKRGDMPDVGLRYNETIDRWEYTHDGIDWKPFGSLNAGDDARITSLENRVTILEGTAAPTAATVPADSSGIAHSTGANVQDVLEDLDDAITAVGGTPTAADVTADTSSIAASSAGNVQDVLEDLDAAITAVGGTPTAADVSADTSSINHSSGANVQAVLGDFDSALDSLDASIINLTHNWVIITSAYTASDGDLILADTSGGAFSITLPASPSTGDTIKFIDAKGTYQTNNLTILRNSENILGTADDLTCNIEDAKFSMTYTDSVEGWKVNY